MMLSHVACHTNGQYLSDAPFQMIEKRYKNNSMGIIKAKTPVFHVKFVFQSKAVFIDERKKYLFYNLVVMKNREEEKSL